MTPISLAGSRRSRAAGALCHRAAGTGRRRTGEAGFSLFELLLVLVILLGLLSAFVVQLDAMRHGGALSEGVIRLESLLRFARAEAALRGKRVRVGFATVPPEERRRDDALAVEPVRLSWEPDPLQEPGVFENLRSTVWADQPLRELLTVREVTTPGRPANAGAALADADGPTADFPTEGDDRATPATIIFDAEGCSESVELVVQATDPDDNRWVLVSLNGLTGEVSHRELDEEERTERERSSAEGGVSSASGRGSQGAGRAAITFQGGQ